MFCSSPRLLHSSLWWLSIHGPDTTSKTSYACCHSACCLSHTQRMLWNYIMEPLNWIGIQVIVYDFAPQSNYPILLSKLCVSFPDTLSQTKPSVSGMCLSFSPHFCYILNSIAEMYVWKIKKISTPSPPLRLKEGFWQTDTLESKLA